MIACRDLSSIDHDVNQLSLSSCRTQYDTISHDTYTGSRQHDLGYSELEHEHEQRVQHRAEAVQYQRARARTPRNALEQSGDESHRVSCFLLAQDPVICTMSHITQVPASPSEEAVPMCRNPQPCMVSGGNIRPVCSTAPGSAVESLPATLGSAIDRDSSFLRPRGWCLRDAVRSLRKSL